MRVGQVSHTFEGPEGWRFHHNSDFSGSVQIDSPHGDEAPRGLLLPACDLLAFADHVAPKQPSILLTDYVDAMRGVEWSARTDATPCCPWCGGLRDDRGHPSDGHITTCAFVRLVPGEHRIQNAAQPIKKERRIMTQGEKMIWAAAFVQALDSGSSPPAFAASRAYGAVVEARRVRPDVADGFGEDSDVTAMINGMLNDD